jgi:hypothetical protein
VSRTPRAAIWVCACLAPFAWLMFWAVFHSVPGQDWVVFHTAAARVFAGDLAMLNDPRAFTDELNRTHSAWLGQALVFHPFVYPPVTLLLAVAFGWLPYLASLIGFLAVSMALMAAALWPWQSTARSRAWLIGGVLACPATAFMLGSGQLSFLVAACVLAGMWWLERRPFLAGLVLSLLCLKPQFVPLIPVALLAGRHWRAMAGGLAGGCALVVVSVLAFGVSAWTDWWHLARSQQAELVAAVRIYDQSVHRCLEFLGASGWQASIGQAIASIGSAVCVWLAFARHARGQLGGRACLVILLCALVVAAPHVGDYDHVLVGIAAMLAVLEAQGPVWLAAGAWIATGFNPPALIAALGVAPLVWLSALTPLLPAGLMIATLRKKVLF